MNDLPSPPAGGRSVSARCRQTPVPLLIASYVFALLLGCARQATDETPERAVQEFIDRMKRVHGDPALARDVVELLAAPARANLEERARRASATNGRAVAPEEMLAPSRFYLSFQPRSWSSERGPDWAVVTAEGDSPEQRKQIRCVRESGKWKVVLDLPELPALERRDTPG